MLLLLLLLLLLLSLTALLDPDALEEQLVVQVLHIRCKVADCLIGTA